MADIITAEERTLILYRIKNCKHILSDKTDPGRAAMCALAQHDIIRTLAALEAAEAEIERLYVLCDWWAKEEGLQRQRAEKAEAENTRLRELCGLAAKELEQHGYIRLHQSTRALNARLRAAAEGKGT